MNTNMLTHLTSRPNFSLLGCQRMGNFCGPTNRETVTHRAAGQSLKCCLRQNALIWRQTVFRKWFYKVLLSSCSNILYPIMCPHSGEPRPAPACKQPRILSMPPFRPSHDTLTCCQWTFVAVERSKQVFLERSTTSTVFRCSYSEYL